MALYNTFVYDTGVLYDSPSVNPTPPSSGGDGVNLAPGSKILIDGGTNINGIFTFSKVDFYDSNISDSISQTYNADDVSLGNMESPSTSMSSSNFGTESLPGTDVVLDQNTQIDPITIVNVGSRFMR